MIPINIGKPPAGSMDWRAKVRKCAQIQIAGHRHGGDGPAAIRAKVIKGAREALSDAPSGPMMQPMRTAKPDGSGMQDDYLLSAAGMFRLPLVEFDVDWSDPMRAETIMAEVTAALDAELPPGDA